jgi:DNA-binding transcriptional ArsR family regulator
VVSTVASARNRNRDRNRDRDRDREVLGFAAEHRFILADQVARLLGVAPATAARRLRDLRAAGLVDREEPQLRHEPPAFRITRSGLAVAGSALGRPREIDLATYRHDVGVAWLAVGAERGIFGEVSEIVSERRMRSEDRRAGRPADAPRHGVRLGIGERGERNLHYPDLVLVTAGGHRVAFELELSHKQPAKRERILAAYAADRRIDAVVYLVNHQAVGNAITRSAARVGADKIQVQEFAWSSGRAPAEHPRAASRASARTSDRGAAARTGGRGVSL